MGILPSGPSFLETLLCHFTDTAPCPQDQSAVPEVKKTKHLCSCLCLPFDNTNHLIPVCSWWAHVVLLGWAMAGRWCFPSQLWLLGEPPLSLFHVSISNALK